MKKNKQQPDVNPGELTAADLAANASTMDGSYPAHTGLPSEPAADVSHSGDLAGSHSPPGPPPLDLVRKHKPIVPVETEELWHQHERAHIVADYGATNDRPDGITAEHAASLEFLTNGGARCLKDPNAPEHGFRFFRQDPVGRHWVEV